MQGCQCSHLDIQVTIQGQIFLNMNVCFNLLVMKWDQQDFLKAYVTSEKQGYPTYIP